MEAHMRRVIIAGLAALAVAATGVAACHYHYRVPPRYDHKPVVAAEPLAPKIPAR
jgi:hypothetical protein